MKNSVPTSGPSTQRLVGQSAKELGEEGLLTWQKILKSQRGVRDEQIYHLFGEGIEELGIVAQSLPDLEEINEKLYNKTGFRGIYVDGLEEGSRFYQLLSERFFPIGNFIRDQSDINYTPAPDIVHDLYGHLPFLMNVPYANFCQQFGQAALKFLNQPEKLIQFERFFWFTIEFGLIETISGNPNSRKVFGAGIASSIAECRYALSSEPTVLEFDIDRIRKQDFRIDEMQKVLFVLKSEEQLYQSLPELCRRVRED